MVCYWIYIFYQNAIIVMSLPALNYGFFSKEIPHLSALAKIACEENPCLKHKTSAIRDYIQKRLILSCDPHTTHFDFSSAGAAEVTVQKYLTEALHRDVLLSFKERMKIFFFRDPIFLKKLQHHFVQMLQMFPFDPHNIAPHSFQLWRSQLLANLAYAELPAGTVVEVPQKIGHHIYLIPYTIDHISLTPKWWGKKHQVVAYTLTPQREKLPWLLQHLSRNPRDIAQAINAISSMLLFCGTPTAPTQKGFITSLLADICPLQHPGEVLYRYGKKKLCAWVQEQAQYGARVAVFGHSLGGILGYLLARDVKDCVEVTAINSPGFKYPQPFNPHITLYHSCFDWISKIGFHPAQNVITVFRRDSARTGHSLFFNGPWVLIKRDPHAMAPFKRKVTTWVSRLSKPGLIFFVLNLYLLMCCIQICVHVIRILRKKNHKHIFSHEKRPVIHRQNQVMYPFLFSGLS
jgi:hypothetical protein